MRVVFLRCDFFIETAYNINTNFKSTFFDLSIDIGKQKVYTTNSSKKVDLKKSKRKEIWITSK